MLFGSAAIERVASDPEVEIVVAGIVGAAGLRSTWAALEAGKRVAFANKETLVVAGPLVTALAAADRGSLIPVDSEHSAIFQALQAGNRSELRRIVLTASGGPFRGFSAAQMRRCDPQDGHGPSDLGDGAEGYRRLGHDDEQGPRDDRGQVAFRA